MDNHTTLHPELVAMEVLKVKTDEDGILYAVQLALLLDTQTYHVVYLPTEILEDDVDSCIRKGLAALAKLFNPISALVPVIDIQTGKLIDTVNINERGFRPDEGETIKVPEGVTIH